MTTEILQAYYLLKAHRSSPFSSKW